MLNALLKKICLVLMLMNYFYCVLVEKMKAKKVIQKTPLQKTVLYSPESRRSYTYNKFWYLSIFPLSCTVDAYTKFQSIVAQPFCIGAWDMNFQFLISRSKGLE